MVSPHRINLNKYTIFFLNSASYIFLCFSVLWYRTSQVYKGFDFLDFCVFESKFLCINSHPFCFVLYIVIYKPADSTSSFNLFAELLCLYFSYWKCEYFCCTLQILGNNTVRSYLNNRFAINPQECIITSLYCYLILLT